MLRALSQSQVPKPALSPKLQWLRAVNKGVESWVKASAVSEATWTHIIQILGE